MAAITRLLKQLILDSETLLIKQPQLASSRLAGRCLSTASATHWKKPPHHYEMHPNDKGRKAWRYGKPEPKPNTPISKEEFEAKQKAKQETLARREVYYAGISSVCAQFRLDLQEQAQKRLDEKGVYQQRLEAERKSHLDKLKLFADNENELNKLRAERVAEKQAILKTKKEAREALLAERAKLQQELNKEMVLRAIEESSHFVTPENLDEKISHALDNPVNYNFAITPEGEKILSTKPPGNLEMYKLKTPPPTQKLKKPKATDTTAPKVKKEREKPEEYSSLFPGPQAFSLGGIAPGSAEWNYIFKPKVQTLAEKLASYETAQTNRQTTTGKLLGTEKQSDN